MVHAIISNIMFYLDVEKNTILILEMGVLSISLFLLTAVHFAIPYPMISNPPLEERVVPGFARPTIFCETKNVCMLIGNTQVCIRQTICTQ